MNLEQKEIFAAKRLAKGLPVFVDVKGERYSIRQRPGSIVISCGDEAKQASFADVLSLLDKGYL